jgi:pseudoazurin|tara:strand:- start:7545 stop:8207 length:663 start_codon:yes stop_codon:yes gene_type:complete
LDIDYNAGFKISINTVKIKLLLSLLTLFVSLTLSSSDMRESAIEERIKATGDICMKGDGCGIRSAGPGYKVSLNSNMGAQPVETNVNKVTLSEGSEHEVKMLNSGADGIMVFEPAVIKVSKGDTIHFKAVDMSHNSASVDGMIPAGANSWNGTINQDISITLDQEGVYVYQCTPHAMMAMVGVIQVGEAVNMDDVISAADTKKSGFVSNTDRLDEYLSRL